LIQDSDPEVPDALDDREADNWRPLLAIATAAGGNWPTLAVEAAKQFSGAMPLDDDTLGVQMLQDLRAAFAKDDRLATSEALRRLHAMDERPWAKYGRRGDPLSARDLARLLKPFGIEPRTVKWPGEVTAKGYMREWFEDAWARYLPPHPSPASPPAKIAVETPFSDASPDVAVTDAKSGFDPRQSRLVTDVTDTKPISGGNGTAHAPGETNGTAAEADAARRIAAIRAAWGDA
jgi:hypothetical protein